MVYTVKLKWLTQLSLLWPQTCSSPCSNVLMMVTSLCVAAYLLKKSTKPVVSQSEIRALWYKIDVAEDGYLHRDGIAMVLQLVEGAVPTEKQLEKTMEKSI